jgi:hypothetical protein
MLRRARQEEKTLALANSFSALCPLPKFFLFKKVPEMSKRPLITMIAKCFIRDKKKPKNIRRDTTIDNFIFRS